MSVWGVQMKQGLAGEGPGKTAGFLEGGRELRAEKGDEKELCSLSWTGKGTKVRGQEEGGPEGQGWPVSWIWPPLQSLGFRLQSLPSQAPAPKAGRVLSVRTVSNLRASSGCCSVLPPSNRNP